MAQTERRRITFLIDSLGMGGAERLLTIYLQHLDTTRFDARVCTLHVREGNPMADNIRRLGIPVDLISLRKLRDWRGLRRLIAYLRQQRTDLLHTQLEFADTMGSLAAKIVGIPSVTTLHTFDSSPKGERLYWRLKLRWWVMRRLCSRIIAVSEGTRQHHIHNGNLPPKQVVTLYNGIDLSRFSQHDQRWRLAKRQALGIPADAPLLTTVAVLRPAKGIQYLIEALPAILEAQPETYYLVVGDGEHKETLKELVEAHELTKRVIFTGMRHDIPDLLAISDLFVLPTLGEALPTVLAEAMAAQKPIVVSEVGGVPEMVSHGRNGLLVPPGEPERLAEACIQILQNPDQAQAMARAGRQIVEDRFNIRKQVQQLEQLYQEILRDSYRGLGVQPHLRFFTAFRMTKGLEILHSVQNDKRT
ncbi:MAG: glycosyltransferase [Ardenticatenaceae bacterium]